MNNRWGSWSLSSEKDPRWNISGESNCGGFMMPDDCRKAMEMKDRELGERPDDLSYSYMKH